MMRVSCQTLLSFHHSKSCDNKVDNSGRRLIDLCKATSLTIGNGRLHNDSNIGDFTFHSYNGSSMVDYLLLDKHDYKHVVYFNILQRNEFSDNSVINVCFKIKYKKTTRMARRMRQERNTYKRNIRHMQANLVCKN